MAGFDVVKWFGGVADGHLEGSPAFTRNWLMLGYQLQRLKVRYVPDKGISPSFAEAYCLFMDSVVGAQADLAHAAVVSIFTPCEIFHAMGVRPVTAEAIGAIAGGAQAESGLIAHAEGAGIPQTYCSYHKILMGLAESGVLQRPGFLACTSPACDANNLTFRALGQRWGMPHTYIDVPTEVSRDSVAYVADQLREMQTAAEDAFHTRVVPEELQACVLRSDQTDQALLRSLPLRRDRYLANTMTTDMMLMLDTHLCLGTERAEALARHSLADLQAAPTYDGLRLVWAHVMPFYLDALGDHLNVSQEAQVVACDMTFDHLPPEGGGLFSPDEPYEYMAERLVRNCFNGPAERRVATLRRLADTTDADGVVVFCHWGCKQTAGAAQLIRAGLEDAGYPVLVLDGDGVDRENTSVGQTSTRFAAFLELLQSRRAVGAA